MILVVQSRLIHSFKQFLHFFECRTSFGGKALTIFVSLQSLAFTAAREKEKERDKLIIVENRLFLESFRFFGKAANVHSADSKSRQIQPLAFTISPPKSLGTFFERPWQCLTSSRGTGVP